MTDQLDERDLWIARTAHADGWLAAGGSVADCPYRTDADIEGYAKNAPPRTPEPLTWTREVPTEPCARVLVRRSDGFVCCSSVEANRHGDLLLRNKDGATGKIYRTYLERFVGMNYHFCVLSIAEPQEGE